MSIEVKMILCAVLGYLFGSLNSSLIVGKFYKIDIREHGSGNAGATNTLRTLGKTAAILATLGDMLKGFIACALGAYFAGNPGLMSAGVFAVAGHVWPIYFGFRGGKGVLTTFAVLLMMDVYTALLMFGLFILIVALTRFVSLGSIAGAALFPVTALIMKRPLQLVIFSSVLCVVVIIKHRENIKRLLKGTESKIGSGKKKAVRG